MSALLAVTGVICIVVALGGFMNDYNNRYPLPLAVIALVCFVMLYLRGVH